MISVLKEIAPELMEFQMLYTIAVEPKKEKSPQKKDKIYRDDVIEVFAALADTMDGDHKTIALQYIELVKGLKSAN